MAKAKTAKKEAPPAVKRGRKPKAAAAPAKRGAKKK